MDDIYQLENQLRLARQRLFSEELMDGTGRMQQLPAPTALDRVETGAVQFGTDWPEFFIRGDNAHSLKMIIRKLNTQLADHPNPEVGDLLEQLLWYAEIIEQDVIV